MRTFKKIVVMLTAAAMLSGLVTILGNTESEADTKLVGGIMSLFDETSRYDNNFIREFKLTSEDHGLIKGETYLVATDIVDGEDCYWLAIDMADRGCTVVFAYCEEYEENVIEAAKETPDVQFCLVGGSGAHTADVPNFQNGYSSIYEGRYLTGIAAGMKLNEMIANGDITEEEAKLGYVGTFTYAEVISGYTAFYLGARSVAPYVTMEVTFTGAWQDSAKEKEAAQKLIDGGCVLISQHTDSLAVPEACEEAGIINVPYNGSTIGEAPDTYLISAKNDWVPYFSYCMDCVLNDEDIADDWTGGFAEGSILLTELNEATAAEGTAEALADAQAKLESGEIKVFDTSAFTVNGETVTSYLADIDPDDDNTGDTEVIIDGAFEESSFRSAPYFDMFIDGITLLDTAEF